MKPILILKFGSAAITRSGGNLDRRVMIEIARQVADLHERYHIAIVSSGAVAAGKSALRDFGGSMSERKAAAAVGNIRLLNQYAQYFEAYGITIAQSLCERHHFAHRGQFLQLQDTFECLWQNNIIPIVNENDVVSDRELKFSDNDELATLLAVGFGAETLLLCTSSGGLLDQNGRILPEVKTIDEQIFSLVRAEKSAVGLGGMASKLTFAKLATRMGIRTVIFGMGQAESVADALAGRRGTVFLPQKSSLSARNRWLASGGIAQGKLQLDSGAVDALRNRRSLLAVGIRRVTGDFAIGEVVELTNEKGMTVAVAKVRLSAVQIAQQWQAQNVEVAHADDIVLLGSG